MTVYGIVDCVVITWDLGTGGKCCSFESDNIFVLSILPDGNRAISGHNTLDSGAFLRLWDLRSGAAIRTFKKTRGEITALAVSQDGALALVGYSSGLVRLCEIATGTTIRSFNLHKEEVRGEVRALAWMPDGCRAMVYSGGLLWMLDVASGTEVCRYAYDEMWNGQVGAMAVATNGGWIVADSGHYATVWDTDTCKELRKLGPHDLAVCALAISPDGRRAVTGSLDKSLRLWDLTQTPHSQRQAGEVSGITALAMMPDRRRVLTVHQTTHWIEQKNHFRLIDIDNLSECHPGNIREGWIQKIAVTKDGRAALIVHDFRNLRLWSLETDSEIRSFDNGDDVITAIGVTPDGRRAISGHREYNWRSRRHLNMKLWDLESGHGSPSPERRGGKVLAFNLDGPYTRPHIG